MHPRPKLVIALALIVGLVGSAGPTAAQESEDIVGAPTFKEGDVISMEKLDSIRQYLPPEFWAQRDFFFYDGMKMEIGPFFRDYTPADVYVQATKDNVGKAKIGAGSSMDGYVSGQPFPMDKIDCKGDPQAGTKIIWNFDYRWEGAGAAASYYYSYWDRGEELPLYYEGTARYIWLAFRPEPEYQASGGDIFRGEKRRQANGIEVDAPFDARGIMLLTYRYKDVMKPEAQIKNDDTWVYVPTLRRVRRISSAQRTDAVSGTDFTFDDLFSFSGIIPQYEWTCLGEMDILAPINSKVKAYPYSRDHNFGPYGLSYADDRWELRHAVKVRFVPHDKDHPYHHKDIYIDKNSMEPLYSFAYDQKEELWKIIWHNHRWSEDDEEYYPGWEGVPKPNDLITVSDTIANVQTGTGNRIEFWDRWGTPLASKGKIRRYIDVGRLTKGR